MDENGYIIEPEELDQEPESSFFLMITYEILADNKLSDFQKLLFAAISGLCRKNGYCWASNNYFQKLFNKSQTQVSEGISKLVDFGYIKRELVYKKKEDKKGKIITTKQIAFRKLFIVLNISNQNTGIPENQNRGIPENQKEIDNPIIENLTFINSKEFNKGVHTERGTLNGENDLDNLEELGKKIGTVGIDIFSEDGKVNVLTHGADEQGGAEKPKKRKGGLGPLYDMIEQMYPGKTYPTANAGLKEYLRRHIGIRKLPTEDKWQGMLDKLWELSSVYIPGAVGNKFIESKAIPILEKAIEGKDGVPYPDFDDIFNGELMEPAVKGNRAMDKGY